MLKNVDRAALSEKVLEILGNEYPDTKPLLNYSNCFELLVAVILSAQCTDNMVNRVTPGLFAAFPDAAALAGGAIPEIENLIRSTGFFRTKARNIKAAAQRIEEIYSGSVPEDFKDLLSLPGVGRKTANVIRAHCFQRPAVIVDTHFTRVAGRIGFTDRGEPAQIETDIRGSIPEASWTDLSMILNLHGRAVCTARKPKCLLCQIRELCGYYRNSITASKR